MAPEKGSTAVLDEEDRQIVESCKQRAAMYRLLASLIDREVNSKTCASIASLAQTPVDPEADACEQRCASGLATMGSSVADFDEDLENTLACDFARVFLASGCYTGKAAVPYESIYTSEEGILMQEARDQVRAIYRAAGVMPGTDDNIPEDYLPFELEYMAVLSDRLSESIEDDDRDAVAAYASEQREFLSNHLLNWTDGLIEDIDRVATTPFYHALGDALGGFLACEDRDITELVDVCLPEAC